MPAKKSAFFVTTSLWVLMMSCPATAAEQAPSVEPAKPYTLISHVDLISAYYLRGVTTTYGNSYPGQGVASINYSFQVKRPRHYVGHMHE